MQATQYQRDNSAMDQSQTEMPLDLIHGTFEATEVRDMLFALLNKQINSYKIKNWKSQVNEECVDGDCMSKINDLNAAKRTLSELCDEAQISRKNLRIRSHVTVEFVEKTN